MDGPVIVDIDLSACFRDDPLYRFPSGTDQETDLVRLDLNGLDSRRVLAQLLTRHINCLGHHIENAHASIPSLANCFGHYLIRNPRQFEIQLKTGNSVPGTAELKVHVAEMIFGSDNVDQCCVAL